jgi:hypothetical protein
MTNLKWLASLVLTAIIVPALAAETRCPGNAASVPLQLTNGHQMIVAVSVNHSGPYKFLLDTGTQMTMVDPALAAELHLNSQSSTVVAGFGFQTAASVAQSDLLEVGSHRIAKQKVIVFHSADRQFRGVLGEDFLGQFDMLIDNEHNILCLDDSPAMAAAVKGRHIALVPPARAANSTPAPRSLIIEARLSGGIRPVRLKLDSGANVSLLFNIAQYLPVQFLRNPSLQGVGLDGVRHTYAAMPPQDLQIGSLELTKVLFFTFADPAEELSRTSAYDGVLTFGTFRRVFICHARQFVVLDPR